MTYTLSTFTFTLVLANSIPQNGLIKVVISDDIGTPSNNFKCIGFLNMA